MSFHDAKIAGVGVDPDGYHEFNGNRGTPEFVVSPSSLKIFFECPSRFLAGYVPPDSKAKKWGSIRDCQELTPELFRHKYAVQPETYKDTVMKCPRCGSITDSAKCRKCGVDREPIVITKPWNANADHCDEWQSQHEGQEILSAKTYGEAIAAHERFAADERIADFFAKSKKQVQVTALWADEKTGLEIPCQCLIDLAGDPGTEWQDCLGDMKTTRCAKWIAFREFAVQMMYDMQGAFDLDMYNAATGEQRTTWVFAIQENFHPWECGREMLGQSFINLGRLSYQAILAKYAQCLKTGVWDGYDDGAKETDRWTIIEPTARHQESRMMALYGEVVEPDQAEPEPEEESEDVIP